jgi:hypothetical protein
VHGPGAAHQLCVTRDTLPSLPRLRRREHDAAGARSSQFLRVTRATLPSLPRLRRREHDASARSSEFLSVTCAARRPDAGNDLGAGVYAASAGDCCSRCESIAACRYYTFNAVATCPGGKRKGCCHAKTSKAGSTPSHGAVSGKSGSFTPPPPPPPAPPGVKNVLVMIADDLRPQLMAAYKHPWMKTPNIDKFSETALVFLRAYVQQQVCSPSRNR